MVHSVVDTGTQIGASIDLKTPLTWPGCTLELHGAIGATSSGLFVERCRLGSRHRADARIKFNGRGAWLRNVDSQGLDHHRGRRRRSAGAGVPARVGRYRRGRQCLRRGPLRRVGVAGRNEGDGNTHCNR